MKSRYKKVACRKLLVASNWLLVAHWEQMSNSDLQHATERHATFLASATWRNTCDKTATKQRISNSTSNKYQRRNYAEPIIHSNAHRRAPV